MLDWYYEIRGWDKRGVPKLETLRKLNLDFTIPVLQEIISLE